MLLLLLQQQLLLLAAAVRHGVPDGKVCFWFTESDSGVFFLFTQTRFIFNVLLGSRYYHTYGLGLPIIYPP